MFWIALSSYPASEAMVGELHVHYTVVQHAIDL